MVMERVCGHAFISSPNQWVLTVALTGTPTLTLFYTTHTHSFLFLAPPQVFRSGYPNEKNYPFLQKLGIKTVVYLCRQPYLPSNRQQLTAMGINIVQFKTDGNLEPFTEIDDSIIVDALRCVIDTQRHPVLVHCEKGNHRTGCLIGCLRKLMNWSLTDIFAEYRRHTGGNVRILDLQCIELFECKELVLPTAATGWVT